MMADEVSRQAQAFILQGGSEIRGAALNIALTFSQSDVHVDLNQVVLARNVP